MQLCLWNVLVKSPSNPDPIHDEELGALICDCLDLLLSTLPPQQANAVRAIDLEGAVPKSVADKHGLSLNEVTMHLALGRQGLKDRIGEMHMICPQHGIAGCGCQLNGDAKT